MMLGSKCLPASLARTISVSEQTAEVRDIAYWEAKYEAFQAQLAELEKQKIKLTCVAAIYRRKIRQSHAFPISKETIFKVMFFNC